MSEKVIICIDDSLGSKAMLADIGQRSWSRETEFTLLHVIPDLPVELKSLPATTLLTEIDSAQRKSSHHLLNNACNLLQEHLIDKHVVHKKILTGKPADCIVELACDINAQMLVLGSRLTDVSKPFAGTVAESVLRRSPCSVEIFRPKQQAKQKPGSGTRLPR